MEGMFSPEDEQELMHFANVDVLYHTYGDECELCFIHLERTNSLHVQLNKQLGITKVACGKKEPNGADEL